MFVKNIHQRPSPEILYNYLTKQFPGASYHCACRFRSILTPLFRFKLTPSFRSNLTPWIFS
jgi:hypothetical protein